VRSVRTLQRCNSRIEPNRRRMPTHYKLKPLRGSAKFGRSPAARHSPVVVRCLDRDKIEQRLRELDA